MKIFVTHASAFDFKKNLYDPIHASELSKMHEFVLPEEQKYNGTWNTKEVIQSSELVIADCSVHSTGAGIEMGWANAAGTPIIVVHQTGTKPTSVVKYVTDKVIEYENGEELIEKITHALQQMQ